MFNVTVQDTPVITVNTRKHQVSYAVDGSLMNPLEAFYATLAGCAAVYAKKACQSLGIPAEGIRIVSKPVAGAGGPLTLAGFKTEVTFPAQFSPAQRQAILDAISHCAVKEVVQSGPGVEFSVVEKEEVAA